MLEVLQLESGEFPGVQTSVRFEIRQGRHKEEVSSENSFVVFGRDPSCDVVVRSPRCSRRHASVRIVPEGFHLLDMGSSNGVYVRDQKVDDAILREGDTFAIGDAFIRILEDEIPPTLSMSAGDAALAERGASGPRLRAVPPPPAPPAFHVAGTAPDPVAFVPRSAAPRVPRPLRASKVLGLASIAVGMALLVGALVVGEALGWASLFFGLAGFASVLAGLARFTRASWSRVLSYGVFAVWALTCVLAPFGAMGFAYQLRGEDHPETDSFFSVVLGLTALLGLLGIIAATLLAHLYIPGPVPV